MKQIDILIKKFEKKEAKVAVLGLGYVGLPLAVVFAHSGFEKSPVSTQSRKK